MRAAGLKAIDIGFESPAVLNKSRTSWKLSIIKLVAFICEAFITAQDFC